jgi:nucleoside phosphorylase
VDTIGPGVLLFALRREAAPFRRRLRVGRLFASAPCWARLHRLGDRPLLLLITGMGPARTAAALQWLLSRPQIGEATLTPAFIVSAGFAAGLHGELLVGDSVVGAEVADLAGRHWATTWNGATQRAPYGRILTVPGIVATAAEKHALFQEFHALAADMESSTVAETCSAAGIPFGCVRVISDDVRDDLPPSLVAALAGGRLAPGQLLSGMLTAPRLVIDLWQLARRTRRAARRLAQVLVELLGPPV